jgi:multidrug efflux system outer membrane protein
VFETERTLLAAQLELLQNHQQILSDTVTLYKALGGGWPSVDVQGADNAKSASNVDAGVTNGATN